MQADAATDLLLIRHAPVAEPGRLVGRTDAAARTEGLAPLSGPAPDRVLSSPARRCTATAAALFPGRAVKTDPRLWEQDFGRFDGAAFAEIPDLGPLPPDALAAHAWEGGESFADLAARLAPALVGLSGRVALVAHAGTVRAALGLALGHLPGGLAFEIAAPSLTRLIHHPGGWAIGFVNRALA